MRGLSWFGSEEALERAVRLALFAASCFRMGLGGRWGEGKGWGCFFVLFGFGFLVLVLVLRFGSLFSCQKAGSPPSCGNGREERYRFTLCTSEVVGDGVGVTGLESKIRWRRGGG